MRIFQSKPALRWLAPLIFALVVAGGGLVAVTATAEPKLPPRSAEQLLVDLQEAQVEALSGTVVQQADLGIPDLGSLSGHSGSTDFMNLVSGTHTLRVWYSGPDKARLALLGELGESDMILNGKDLWTWSSDKNEATHRTFTASPKDRPEKPIPADAPKTPQEAAQAVLKALDSTTTVRTDSNVTVAGRAAYELVLQPKDDRSLITEVRIAIDGTEHIPLRVTVLADQDKTAFQVGFTAVDFARPDDAQFTFNPPPGAKVTEVPAAAGKPDMTPGEDMAPREDDKPSGDHAKKVGSGWTTVMVSSAPPTDAPDDELAQVVNSLPQVSGSWGSGRLLRGTAFSVLVTDDGRIAAGAVKPELLYDALGK